MVVLAPCLHTLDCVSCPPIYMNEKCWAAVSPSNPNQFLDNA